MSQFNINFAEDASIVNLASIRTFEGCNVAMVRGLRKKDIRLKIYLSHSILLDVLKY